jgi:hypothetical protein
MEWAGVRSNEPSHEARALHELNAEPCELFVAVVPLSVASLLISRANVLLLTLV